MIEVEQLHKRYGTTQAIQDVSFSVEKGEILGFLGPNGAGKTTTMRILTGYLPASSGTARIAGFDVHDQSMDVRQRIGYLPESPPLYSEMSVEGFLHFVARIKGVSAGDRPQRVDRSIEQCGLSDRRKSLIRKLSKGYRQRVGIAQAIVHDPPVIILDEPTVGLDPRQIIEVRNLIKSLAGNHTIILSTHILPEVSMTCSQVAIINRGQIVATDRLDNLMEHLTGGTYYDVEVGGGVDGVETAIGSYLGYLPNLRSVDPLPRNDLPEGRYRFRITVEPGSEPGSEIAAAILDGKLQLHEMRRSRASLEDVFLQLTTEEKMAEDAAEDDAETSEAAAEDETSSQETSSQETSSQETSSQETSSQDSDPNPDDSPESKLPSDS
ncbi:MAG: ATP-binding cassette domain-containing protein [Phormidium sp. SL48-SHIP]|nr:MAG: ATP-binding cassette domain-containing protein [Phormidium sp. SL48-SHIP]